MFCSPDDNDGGGADSGAIAESTVQKVRRDAGIETRSENWSLVMESSAFNFEVEVQSLRRIVIPRMRDEHCRGSSR